MLAGVARLKGVLLCLLSSDASDGRLCYVLDSAVHTIDVHRSFICSFKATACDDELLASANRAAVMAQAVDMRVDTSEVAISAVPIARRGRLGVPHGVASTAEPEIEVGLLGALL